MSEGSERDNVIQRRRDLLNQQVQAGVISPEQAANSLDRYVAWLYSCDMGLFAEKLAARQGTHIPNFRALYHEREELDCKAFGSDHSTPAPPE